MKVNVDDIEADTTQATDDQLRTISNLLKQVPVLEQKVADAELALKVAREALLKVTDIDLPEALSSAGYSAPTKCLIAGMEVKFDTYLQAAITQEKQDEAFAWLRANGHGDLIKREIKFTFPKGSAAFCKLFMAAYEKLRKQKAAKLQIKTADKESVHAGTLKAFVKAELAEGREVPAETFSLYVGKHVDVRPAAAAPAI